MKICSVFCAGVVWLSGACYAQMPAGNEGLTPAQIGARAKAQNVPEIPF